MSIRYLCAKYLLETFVKMSLIRNNDIYVFTHLSAILVTRELRSISRSKYIHTLAYPETKKTKWQMCNLLGNFHSRNAIAIMIGPVHTNLWKYKYRALHLISVIFPKIGRLQHPLVRLSSSLKNKFLGNITLKTKFQINLRG